LALLVAQTVSAVLLYRSAEQRREMIAANSLAFQLVTEPRFDFRTSDPQRPGKANRGRWQRLRIQRTDERPVLPGEVRDTTREELLHSILEGQGVEPAELVVVVRDVVDDSCVMDQLGARERGEWGRGRRLAAGRRRRCRDG